MSGLTDPLLPSYNDEKNVDKKTEQVQQGAFDESQVVLNVGHRREKFTKLVKWILLMVVASWGARTVGHLFTRDEWHGGWDDYSMSPPVEYSTVDATYSEPIMTEVNGRMLNTAEATFPITFGRHASLSFSLLADTKIFVSRHEADEGFLRIVSAWEDIPHEMTPVIMSSSEHDHVIRIEETDVVTHHVHLVLPSKTNRIPALSIDSPSFSLSLDASAQELNFHSLFLSAQGDIELPVNVHAQMVDLNTVTGKIEGNFNVSRKLVLHTVTGDINATVFVHPLHHFNHSHKPDKEHGEMHDGTVMEAHRQRIGSGGGWWSRLTGAMRMNKKSCHGRSRRGNVQVRRRYVGSENMRRSFGVGDGFEGPRFSPPLPGHGGPHPPSPPGHGGPPPPPPPPPGRGRFPPPPPGHRGPHPPPHPHGPHHPPFPPPKVIASSSTGSISLEIHQPWFLKTEVFTHTHSGSISVDHKTFHGFFSAQTHVGNATITTGERKEVKVLKQVVWGSGTLVDGIVKPINVTGKHESRQELENPEEEGYVSSRSLSGLSIDKARSVQLMEIESASFLEGPDGPRGPPGPPGPPPPHKGPHHPGPPPRAHPPFGGKVIARTDVGQVVLKL
ncbi:hypothetical protein M231_00191 [Tremella mesenterica]|uniref:Adhesin domain-containing protein n=1 Tax=Tremella mesenterica TaxID=5217 RepID=A0A4V1M550_TREME|nr:hypothetical protein M231_00191 [Tremella mesenterica]